MKTTTEDKTMNTVTKGDKELAVLLPAAIRLAAVKAKERGSACAEAYLLNIAHHYHYSNRRLANALRRAAVEFAENVA